MKIKTLRFFSVLLAVAGLALLYLFSVRRELPAIRISQIEPAMNFATVRLSGEVIRDGYLFDSGGMVFDLDDGSGRIPVYADRPLVEELLQRGQIPRKGDHVEVAGTLGTGADRESKLYLNSVGQLLLERDAGDLSRAVPARLADLSAERQGETVSVSGILTEIVLPAPGSRSPYVLTLEEGGKKLDVVFWDSVFYELKGRFPAPGARLQVCGRVSLYRGTLQLRVRSADNLEVREGTL